MRMENKKTAPKVKFRLEPRDREVLLALEQWGVMSAEQIILKFFPFPWGKRKAQERLTKLYRAGKLHRWRGDNGWYCYSLEPRNNQSDHRLAVNWVRLYFEHSRPDWEKFHTFQYEQDYGILRADGFAAMKDFAASVKGEFRLWFVELDRSHRNRFDKVQKYCRLFREGGYQGRWWVELTDKFPRILVVTTSEERKQKILAHIQEENEADLRFEVRLLSDIKEAVSNGKTHNQNGRSGAVLASDGPASRGGE